jgi:hypothetical protein
MMSGPAAPMWVGFLLRLLVAVWNTFYGPSLGAEGDASGFHVIAAEYSRSFNADRFHVGLLYAYALGLVYSVTVASLLLGCVLSCLAWLLSAHMVIQTMRLLSFGRRAQFNAMLVYALLPSAILWTSVTMREPYQLLCVTLAIYAALRITLQGSKVHWVVLILAVAGMSVLHGALLGFGVLVIEATLGCMLFRKSNGYSWIKVPVVVALVVCVLFLGFTVFRALYEYPVVEQGFGEAVESYQRGGLSIPARTHYKSEVEIDGLLGFLLFLPVTFLQYLFEPMPWNIDTILDVGPVLENMLRAFLIWSACMALLKLSPQRRIPIFFIFLGYLVLEGAWSLGTVNWGTSARHHIPSLGLLTVAAFAAATSEKESPLMQPLPTLTVHNAA